MVRPTTQILRLQCLEIADLQKMVWHTRMKDGDSCLILPVLKSSDAYCALMRTYSCVRVQKILDSSISDMIRKLDLWKNIRPDASFREFKIIDGRVAYKEGVSYSTATTHGYRTLWPYFKEVEANRVSAAVFETALGIE